MGKEEVKKQSPVEEAGFHEEVAEDFLITSFGGYVKTGYPRPKRRLRLVYESDKASLEYTYFWFLNAARQDFGFGEVIKTIDTFGASENSSFWGLTEQRKGIQQDRTSQYLQTIGKMTQDLFKIVREIRILKERLALYEGVRRGRQADDIALKGYWVDLVEGKQGQVANIYAMAQQVGFGTLPDLFFSIFVDDDDDVGKVVDEKAKEFNDKVKEVLKRKLATYRTWRKHTEEEMRNRHRFTLRYMRQHWSTIQMYMSWIKPYLRNVQKLQAPEAYDKNPDLISSFEGALIEIEFVARQASHDDKKRVATVLATFNYRVKPQMQFQAESYQHRGPVHVGRVEVSLRSYAWKKKDVENYIKLKERETLELIGMVDKSLKDAMDAMGEELLRYLREAGEEVTLEQDAAKAKPMEAPKMNLFEPFLAIFGGFKEIFMLPAGPLLDAFKEMRGKKQEKDDRSEQYKEKPAGTAAKLSYQMYKNYKKSNQMVTW